MLDSILSKVPSIARDFKNVCFPKSVAYTGFSNGGGT